MGRHSHDRAGSVFEQHIIGDPDLHFFAVEGIQCVGAGEHAFLFHIGGGPVDFTQLPDFGDEFPDSRFFRLAGNQFLTSGCSGANTT